MKRNISLILLLAMLCCVSLSSAAASPVLSDNALISGDVNADGEITSTDYIIVKKAFLKEYALTSSEKSKADMDDDRKITISDYLKIKTLFLKNQSFSDDKFSGVLESQPMYRSYHFSSYEETVQALTQKDSSQYIMLREEQKEHGAVYQKTLSKFANGEIKVAIPCIDESPMPLQSNKDYPMVTLISSELYNLPWIWYDCVIENQIVDIKISYLDAIYNVEGGKNATYRQILNSIAPSAPSPDNYQNYESYKNIYEKNIVLKDGTSVTAMISEVKNSSKEYVMFYYEGLLIVLDGESELFTNEFWSKFSIKYIQ